MGKRIFVAVTVDDIIRPVFVKRWTEFLRVLAQQKFTFDIGVGLESLQTVSDEYDYALLMSSDVLFEPEHFLTLFHKMYDKDILCGVLRKNNTFLDYIPSIEKGVYATKEDLVGEIPVKVDCGTVDWVLFKQSTFADLKTPEVFVPVRAKLEKEDGSAEEVMLPLTTSLFIRLKERGFDAWIDPTVQLKKIQLLII